MANLEAHWPSFLVMLRLLGSVLIQHIAIVFVMNLLNSNGNEHMKALSFVTYEPKHDHAVGYVELYSNS